MGDRLVTTDMGRNWGLCPYAGAGAGFPSNTMAWAEDYLHTKWHLDPSSRLAGLPACQVSS